MLFFVVVLLGSFIKSPHIVCLYYASRPETKLNQIKVKYMFKKANKQKFYNI